MIDDDHLRIDDDRLRPRVLAMRQEGVSWYGIGRALGICDKRARGIAEPDYRERRLVIEAERRRWNRKPAKSVMPRSFNPAPEDIAARLAEIPPDTRTLTGVICGDPLPGRSALHRKLAGE